VIFPSEIIVEPKGLEPKWCKLAWGFEAKRRNARAGFIDYI
jgi:hypothetical protein